MKKRIKTSQADSDDLKVIAYYDSQTDAEVAKELTAAISDPDNVMVQVPRSLVDEVLKLIQRKKKPA